MPTYENTLSSTHYIISSTHYSISSTHYTIYIQHITYLSLESLLNGQDFSIFLLPVLYYLFHSHLLPLNPLHICETSVVHPIFTYCKMPTYRATTVTCHVVLIWWATFNFVCSYFRTLNLALAESHILMPPFPKETNNKNKIKEQRHIHKVLIIHTCIM